MSKLKVNEIDTKTGTTITVAAGKTLAGTDIIDTTQIAADAITATELANNAVDTNAIADNQVTLAKMEDGTQGDILYYAASGVPTRLAAGTSGQFLKTQGSGQNPVYGTVTEYNDVNILNDIATLALHSATQNNQTAYNLSNAFVDQYEDNSGLDVLTDVLRNTSNEYMSTIGDDTDVLLLIHSDSTQGNTTFTDSSSYSRPITAQGSPDHNTAVTLAGFGATSIKLGGPNEALMTNDSTDFKIQADFTVDWWMKLDRYNSDTEGWAGIGPPNSAAVGGNNDYLNIANSNTGTLNVGVTVAGTQVDTGYTGFNTSDWFHVAVVRYGGAANNTKFYVDGYQTYQFTATAAMPSSGTEDGRFYWGHSGNRYMDGYVQELRVTKDARTHVVGDPMYISSGSNFTAPTAPYSPTVTNASGNYTSTTETALGTVSKMSIVVLYKNASGTATLDTDLVAQVSANGGTNYTAAPLTPGGTFSTGILIAKSNDITIAQTGTAPKYKISFANQATGTKVTQVYGVALMY